MASTERGELKGQVLDGRYRVGNCIGIGGTGVVFDGLRLSDGATFVIKTMRPVFAHNVDLARRLRREREVSDRVAHPGIVPVVDEGILSDGSPFIVMEKLGGESLARLLLRRGRLGDQETATIAMRVAAILHAMHQRGYVHRDVKPEHVLLEGNVRGGLDVHLLDAGVCAAETAPLEEKEREKGRVFGTPTYSSPEQACGDPYVDGRADIFGLGIVMFECLTGRVPFTASSISALLRRIIREDAPRVGLLESRVSRDMDTLVARALARSPDVRFPNARALAHALASQCGGRLETERRMAPYLCKAGQSVDSILTLPSADVNTLAA